MQQGVFFFVENADNRIICGKDAAYKNHRQGDGCDSRIAQNLLLLQQVAFAVSVADQRLDTLGDAGKDGCSHDGTVGYHTVGRNGSVAAQIKEQKVENHHHQADGKLVDHGGRAQLAEVCRGSDGETGLPQVEAVALSDKVDGQNRQADYWRNRCRKGGTEHAPSKGIDEDIVQDDIGCVRNQHGDGCQFRVAIVSDESHHDLVQDDKRSETENHAHVFYRQAVNDALCAQEGCNLRQEQVTEDCNGKAYGKAGENRVGVDFVGMVCVAAGFADGESGGTPDADHQGDGEHETVQGDGHVQRGQPVGTDAVGDEEGIRQDIA